MAAPRRKGDAAENLIRFEVKRVLKGVLEQEVVVTRTPTAAAEFIGKDWVVMLSPEYMAGRHQFGGIYGMGLEPQIQAALAKVVIVATAVEGKQLAKKEGEAAEVEVKFRVERVIKGKLAEAVITVRREGMVAEFVGREWVVMLSEKFVGGDAGAAEVYVGEVVERLKEVVGEGN